MTLVLFGIALLLANAFFVGAEFAVLAVRRAQLQPHIDNGRRAAVTALWATENMPLMLAGAQLGITVCSLGLGAVAEPAIAHLIEPLLHAASVSDQLVHPLAFAVALIVVVYAHVVLGEMVPKNLALAAPDRAAMALAPPLVAFSRGLKPLIMLLNALSLVLLRLVGVRARAGLDATVTTAEVAAILTESQKEGLLADEAGVLAGALGFNTRLVSELMIPLAAVVTVRQDQTPADVERLVGKTGFSRFPVMGTAGSIVGYVHVKDLLAADGSPAYALPMWPRFRVLAAIPATGSSAFALSEMMRVRSHLLLVQDSAGNTVGVLFLEDILEELVGEVLDATQRNGDAEPPLQGNYKA